MADPITATVNGEAPEKNPEKITANDKYAVEIPDIPEHKLSGTTENNAYAVTALYEYYKATILTART